MEIQPMRVFVSYFTGSPPPQKKETEHITLLRWRTVVLCCQYVLVREFAVVAA